MGWNQPRQAEKSKPDNCKGRGRPSSWRGLAAGAIVVAIGGVAALWTMLRPPEAPVKDVDGGPSVRAAEPPAPAATPAMSPGKRIGEIIHMRHGRKNLTETDKAEIAALQVQMASNTVSRQQSAPGTPRKRSVFTCHSDQVIAMVLTAGETIPPFPGTEAELEREFVRSLGVPIEIGADDSESVRKVKQMVVDARAVIDAQMKEGRGIREILEEHRKSVARNAELRKEVRDMTKKMIEEGNGDLVEDFLKQANRQLSEKGADPVERPLTREEHKERARQRRLESLNHKQENK